MQDFNRRFIIVAPQNRRGQFEKVISGTTGIAANLLGRRYLGLELEDKFLEMSKARREKIENLHTRNDYLERLAKGGNILPPDNFFAADDNQGDYAVPWL